MEAPRSRASSCYHADRCVGVDRAPPRQHVITSKHTQTGLALLSSGFLASTGHLTGCPFRAGSPNCHRRYTSDATKRHQLGRVTPTANDRNEFLRSRRTGRRQLSLGPTHSGASGRKKAAASLAGRCVPRAHMNGASTALSTADDSESFLFASLSHQ